MAQGNDTGNVCRETIRRALAVLFDPGDVVELRIPEHPRPAATTGGYFKDFEMLTQTAARYSGRSAGDYKSKVEGVYVIPQCIDPALLGRLNNRVEEWAKKLTSKGDVLRWRWLVGDVDPARASGIPSTDVEHEAALAKAQAIARDLVAKGWPCPVQGDTGNGAVVLWRIDLPNNAEAEELVKRCLEALSVRYSDTGCSIDLAFANPAQAIRLPGTFNNKGDGIPGQRPHRLARLLRVPEKLEVVSLEQLHELAAEAQPAKAGNSGSGSNGYHRGDRRLNVGDYLAHYGVAYKVKSGEASGGRKVYALTVCPMNEAHVNGEAAIMQDRAGKLSFYCFHNGCQGVGWQEVKARIGEPLDEHFEGGGCRSKRSSSTQSNGKQTKGKAPELSKAGSEVFDLVKQRLQEHFDFLWADRGTGELYSASEDRRVKRRDIGLPVDLAQEILEVAPELCCTRNGVADLSCVPALFQRILDLVFHDYLNRLPDEIRATKTGEGAREWFWALVRRAFNKLESFSYDPENGGPGRGEEGSSGGEDQARRRAIWYWCRRYANASPDEWTRVHESLALWVRKRDEEPRSMIIAVHHDLFAQISCRTLEDMGSRKFNALARKYGLAIELEDGKEVRLGHGGKQVIVLAPAFIIQLEEGMLMPLPRTPREVHF